MYFGTRKTQAVLIFFDSYKKAKKTDFGDL
jgi:hypothetical protein